MINNLYSKRFKVYIHVSEHRLFSPVQHKGLKNLYLFWTFKYFFVPCDDPYSNPLCVKREI